METWKEIGYWNLHGHPATNPGGIRVGEKPYFYSGYRAFSLLPVYWLYLLTGDFNSALTIIYWLLTFILAVTIWWFLDKTVWALLVAGAFCLSPGYVRLSAMDWDPVPVAMMIGIPVMMVLVQYMAAPRPSRTRGLAVLALVAVYSQMEWATVFDLGVGWAACAVLWWPSKRRQFMLFTALIVCLVAASSLALMWKKSGGSSGVFGTLFDYTIGPGGYDRHGMSWPLALKRLGTANAVGLLPLWITFFAAAWPFFRAAPRQTFIACLPLWTAWVEVLVLRNDMAHHQWMNLPAVALGIVLSLYLLRRPVVPEDGRADAGLINHPVLSSRVILLFVVGALLYCLVVLSIFRANDAEVQSLICLVTRNTPRQAWIEVGTDLGSVMNADNLGVLLDRRCIPVGSSQPSSNGGPEAIRYLINSAPLSGYGPLVAQSTVTKGDVVAELLDWYRTNISRKNFRLQQVGTCYLYRLERP
ncbi:MAG TPA: hypothetical protein VMP11_03025 [Verrucomicrobiae bacterium]|nr:hypothetical protein [Verrucomicrobiae bacterium]